MTQETDERPVQVDLVGVQARLASMEAGINDAISILQGRMQAVREWILDIVRASPGGDHGANLDSVAPPATARAVSLVNRISPETAGLLMRTLEQTGAVLDEATRGALEKHVQSRFQVRNLHALNEAMGQQLITDLNDVVAGKLVLSYTEDGAMRFTGYGMPL